MRGIKYIQLGPDVRHYFFSTQRKKRKQIEKYEFEKQRFTFKIEWTDSCTFTLTLHKTSNVAKVLKKSIIGTRITYHIIENKEGDHLVYFIDDKGNRVETMLFGND